AIPITADGMMAAIAGSVFGVVPIEQFVNAGETLVTDGSGSGNNTTIWQRAVDQCNAWFIADGKPRKIQVKPGSVMRFVRQGFEPLSGAPYGLRWKSGVGIASNGDPTSVTFVAPTNATMFHAAKSFGSIEHVYVDAHTVDGSQQSNATYTTMMKAWFIQDLNHARFRDILIKETWATGFGCDFLRDTVVTGVARGCGRGLIELAVDPLTTSGGSGFGIGTGLFEVEDYVLDVSAFDCGFHGVFTETQELYKVAGDITWHFSKGSRIRAYVEGNFVGFRDCGSDGLTADIIAVNNTYAGVLHDRTVLAPSAGRNGRLRGELSGNGTGLLIGLATAGAYAFDVQAHHNVGDGIATKSGGGFAPHTAIRGASYDNGGRGIEIGLPSTDLLVDVRTWDNTEEGLALLGTSLAATGIQISGDYRGDGAVVEQAITGSYRIDARGLSATAPWGLAVTPSGSTSLVAAWEEPLIADDITDYTVQYRLVGDSVWTTFAHAASTATTQTLTALNAGDQYEVRVAAVSPAGTSAWAAAFGWTGALLMGDTFNRADATGGLGTMDSGCSPVAYAGGVSWSISNNRAFSTATGTASIAAFNTGVVARTIEATLTNYLAGSTVGVLLRGTTSSSNVGVVRSSGGFWQIVKVVSGTTTALLVSTIPVSSGDTVKVVCLAGGVYRMFVNGQFVGSVTDSHLATDTNAALRAVTPNSFDDLHVYA
ncbi:MAG TPA: fibronectin type III domain-containing protein, partial [Mycobacterium sp.]